MSQMIESRVTVIMVLQDALSLFQCTPNRNCWWVEYKVELRREIKARIKVWLVLPNNGVDI